MRSLTSSWAVANWRSTALSRWASSACLSSLMSVAVPNQMILLREVASEQNDLGELG